MEAKYFVYLRQLSEQYFNLPDQWLYIRAKAGIDIDNAKRMFTAYLHYTLSLSSAEIARHFNLKCHSGILARLKSHLQNLEDHDYADAFHHYWIYLNGYTIKDSAFSELEDTTNLDYLRKKIERQQNRIKVLEQENDRLRKENESFKRKRRLEKAIFS